MTYDVHAHIVPVELMELLRTDGARFGIESFESPKGGMLRLAGRIEIGPFPQ
jgi:hypothetical protein